MADHRLPKFRGGRAPVSGRKFHSGRDLAVDIPGGRDGSDPSPYGQVLTLPSSYVPRGTKRDFRSPRPPLSGGREAAPRKRKAAGHTPRTASAAGVLSATPPSASTPAVTPPPPPPLGLGGNAAALEPLPVSKTAKTAAVDWAGTVPEPPLSAR